MFYGLIGTLMLGISYLFTEKFLISILLACFLSPLIKKGMDPLLKKRESRKERKNLYHCLTVLSATFAAGTSFRGGLLELEKLFQGEEKGVAEVVDAFNRAFEMKKSLKPLKEELPRLVMNRETELFFSMMIDAVYSGANKKRLIERTSSSLQTMIELDEEMEKIINGKKMEAFVISLMPILFLFLLKTMFADYMLPLESSVEGQVVLYTSFALMVIAEGIMFRMIANVSV